MDKARRPHVVRMLTVERTRVPSRPPQTPNWRPNLRNGNIRGLAGPPQSPNRRSDRA